MPPHPSRYHYHLLSGHEDVRADLGSATLTPSSGVVVESVHSFRVTYRVGRVPIGDGGALRFSIPLPFTKPQFDRVGKPGHVRAVCSRPGIALSLSINDSMYTLFDVRDGHCGARSYSVFVRIRGGTLRTGDTIRLHYLRAKAPAWSARFEFAVGVDPDGKRSARSSGYCLVARFPRLYVEAGKASHFVLYQPSRLDRRSPVTVIARDRTGNFDRNFDGEKLLQPSSKRLRFRHGVARASFAAGSAPVVRVGIGAGVSNPSRPIPDFHLYWGDLHNHSLIQDGLGTPDENYRYGRDVARLDFQSLSEHSFFDSSVWPYLVEAANRFDQPGRFVTFVSYEVRTPDLGDIIFYFLGKSAPPPPPGVIDGHERQYPLARYVSLLRGQRVFGIPHCHWKPSLDYPVAFQRRAIPLMEIYSQFGDFERIGAEYYGGHKVQPSQSVRHNLLAGLRFGFSAGSDNHSGHPGYGRHLRHAPARHGGLTAVHARSLTREGIFDALMERRCFATTGCRMIIEFRVNDRLMGNAVRGAPAQRVIRLKVNGQAPLKRLVLVRNGEEVKAWNCAGRWDVEFEWTDREPLRRLWLPATKFSRSPFAFYYLRVEQTDGGLGWASPVWFYKI